MKKMQRDAEPQTVASLLRAPKRRKLDWADIDAIARVVIKNKCTERDACLHLGLNPAQWDSYKSKKRRKEGFDILLAKLKEAKLEGLIDNIDEVGRGIGVKQRDWRASAWIAERIAPERFALQANHGSVSPTATIVNIQLVAASLDKLLGCATIKRVDQSHDIKLLGWRQDSKTPQ
jgi:hypothetical protein